MPKARRLGDRKITIEFADADSPGEFPKIQHLVKDLAHKERRVPAEREHDAIGERDASEPRPRA